jgi:hypothetical protein
MTGPRTLATIAVALLLLSAPAAARADADEASLELHALSGAARAGDPLADTAATTPLYGGGLRFTYATSDYFAYEALLDLAMTGDARFPAVDHGGDSGDLERPTRLGRLTAGVTARLGVRLVPTFSLALGGQARQFADGRLIDEEGEVVASVAADSRLDLVARAAVGFDYRIDRHFIAGLTASVTHALWGPSWDAVEGGLHLSYYFYPRWF